MGRYRLILVDISVAAAFVLAIASVLGVQFLLSPNLPTGGDTASHLLYAWLYADELLANGQITAWLPEVFGGLPFLSYYFPLPFIVVAALSKLIAFAPAMKIGMFAAAMLLPAAAWMGSVYLLRLPRYLAIWAALAALAFVLHEQNSIWGGNLLSTLAGEFAYSYGVLFSLLTLMAWQRAIATGRYVWLAALLEAATGFSHGFALLVTGFATTAFLFERQRFRRNLGWLVAGHGLAFFLLAGWLWPMMEMHSLTIPNDALFEVHSWLELLPRSVQPVAIAGALACAIWLVVWCVPPWRRGVQHLPCWPQLAAAFSASAFFGCSALLSAVGFLAAGKLGLADIRFFPFVWLLGGVAAAWMWGALLLALSTRLSTSMSARWGVHVLSLAAALFLLGWISMWVRSASDWGLWNHAGLESKPQWRQLSYLFPALSGQLDSPRLLFEHDPANNDVGSTRTLEALPMFIGHRPVLEGLYMESALLGPAIYQLQSEVSARPSSPLARFPSGHMDIDAAAGHMRALYANEVLIRSAEARRALSASPEFELRAEAEPFAVFRLRQFDSRLVDFPDRPLRWLPKQRWMEQSFRWFRSRERFAAEWPVFVDGAPPELRAAPYPPAQAIDSIRLTRERISWRTAAVGAPHLVRVAWHPRWRLLTRGEIYLAAPGYMLVVPHEADVKLDYGHTQIAWLGIVASTFAALALLAWIAYEVLWRRQSPASDLAWPRERVGWLWPSILLALGVWAYANNAERLYTGAWDHQRASRFNDAASLFDRAYQARRGDAKREEALFWSAKARELAGQRDAALQRYRELTQHYEGFWLPESLYTQAKLAREIHADDEARLLGERLQREFPGNSWAQRYRNEFAAR